MIELAAPLTLLLCSIILEASILQFIKKIDVNWREIIFNLNSGHIILWLFHGLEVLCFNYFYTHFSLNLFEHLPVVFMWLFAIFSWDLGFYWLHRLHHKVPFLWAIHVVHHQGESFNLSLAMRNSWYSSLTAIPFFIFLAILGIPTSVFVIISVIHYSLQFFNHNSLTPKLGFLEKILVTPSHHRIHHIKDKFYSSHNFGGSFIFWDKLFGTFQKSLPKTEFSYGAYIKSSQNPFFASNIPLLRFLNIQYQPKQNVAQYHFSNYLFAIGGFLLFTLTLCYIFKYGYGYNNISIDQYLFFTYLVLGTIALSGISEEQNWGIFIWVALTLSLPIVFLYFWHWDAIYWKIFISLTTFHGIFTLVMWLKNRSG